MKILFLGDLHLGARNGNPNFLRMMDDYFKEELFPYILENGVEVVVDGVTMTKHLNSYRTVSCCEPILLELTAGKHDVYLRAYNRFENELNCGMIPASAPVVYSMDVALPKSLHKGTHMITISAADHDSEHKDCGLHNLMITM